MSEIAVVVSVVVWEDGRLLLVRQQDPDEGESFWAPPTGAIIAGESLIEAAQRQVQDETGLELTGLRRQLWTSEAVAHSRENHLLCFGVEAAGYLGAIDIDDEEDVILEADFFAPEVAVSLLAEGGSAFVSDPLLAWLEDRDGPQRYWLYKFHEDGPEELEIVLPNDG